MYLPGNRVPSQYTPQSTIACETGTWIPEASGAVATRRPAGLNIDGGRGRKDGIATSIIWGYEGVPRGRMLLVSHVSNLSRAGNRCL